MSSYFVRCILNTVSKRQAMPAMMSAPPVRYMAAQAAPAKREGDISSAFVSLSGTTADELPERFADIKRQLLRGHETEVAASWNRLLREIAKEKEIIARNGSDIIPQIDFQNIDSPGEHFVHGVRRRGVGVIRGVVPEAEAREYKAEVEEYVRANPWTNAFPKQDPQVYELYWSAPQLRARLHENMLSAQRFLMSFWHSKTEDALVSTSQPLVYADRLRIRQPGDAAFALGPHIDGGSVERWEPDGYGLGHTYDEIWHGKWESHDPWEASCRLAVKSDLYSGAGACSALRFFQGWLSMSRTGPGEGTLLVNPMLRLSMAYCLLRPFFAPIRSNQIGVDGHWSADFLDPANWRLLQGDEITSELQGAYPGHGQELSETLHPHLDLARTMIHIPQINPGDFVVWHCDTIHAVDKVHKGKGDSSVMYIPVCPVTESNAEYLKRQRDTFRRGTPSPDFPGGKGESQHTGRPDDEYVRKHTSEEGLRGLGLAKMDPFLAGETKGAREAMHRANEILGFT